MKKLLLEDFIGNEQAKGKVSLLIHQALTDDVARLPDMAFIGESGLGKNTLAEAISNETNRKLLVINSTVIRDPFQFRALVVDLFSNSPHGCIILLDECHALPKRIQDNLLTATNDPRELHTSYKDQTFRDSIPQNCSFIFATTHSGKIKAALMTRLEIIEILPYSLREQLEITLKYLERRHGITKGELEPSHLVEIAKRARNGRQITKFCDSLMMYKKKFGLDKITTQAIEECFKILDIDAHGLTRLDRIMLKKLSEMNTFVGIDTLDAILPCSKQQIKEQLEPYLLRRGYIIRSASGRMITPKGRAAVKDFNGQ